MLLLSDSIQMEKIWRDAIFQNKFSVASDSKLPNLPNLPNIFV